MNRTPILLAAVTVAFVIDTGTAAAQQRSALDPVGNYTLTAQQGGTQITVVLRILRQNDVLTARAAPAGQQELALNTVQVDGRTVTLSETTPQGVVRIVLDFDSDSTFSGSWSMGADSGTHTGRRGVAAPITCPGGAAQPQVAPETAPRRTNPDPDSARIITSDVRLFWSLLDRSTHETLTTLLQCGYLNGGTQAVRDFIPARIISAERLAEAVTTRRERYEAARNSSQTVATVEPAIRTVFRELKAQYPDAVFPDVYFVIGRLNTGGTTSGRGLLIGAEMYTDHSGIPQIVAHELVHYQQKPFVTRPTLLAQSIMEGSADFVAELISGSHINHRAHEYGRANERQLWGEFTRVMHGHDYTGWLYGNPPAGRPSDLGYFLGYRIAQAYYTKAGDKRQALRDILLITDHAAFLKQSGYDGGS